MEMTKNILLTGATGFVGKRLASSLVAETLHFVGRSAPEGVEGLFTKANLSGDTDFTECLKGIDVVIHAAARVHVMKDPSNDPLSAFRAVNTVGTLNLARQAAAAGVKRFIFISTIKVNGDSTSNRLPFKFSDQPNPKEFYGISKHEAELGLQDVCMLTGMEFVIIRPPLVYGHGVKANFATMMSLAKLNLPLPLGGINNKRSLVALDNLVDLIKICVAHDGAKNQVFLVSDDNDISTSSLFKSMIRSVGKIPWLIRVPSKWIVVLGVTLGKKDLVDRLCGDLQVDIEHTKATLGWIPKACLKDVLSKL
jgi:UDP-glucose 4-epimerase